MNYFIISKVKQIFSSDDKLNKYLYTNRYEYSHPKLRWWYPRCKSFFRRTTIGKFPIRFFSFKTSFSPFSNVQVLEKVVLQHFISIMSNYFPLYQVKLKKKEFSKRNYWCLGHRYRVESINHDFDREIVDKDRCKFVSKWVFVLPWVIKDTAKIFSNAMSLNENERNLIGFEFNIWKQS